MSNLSLLRQASLALCLALCVSGCGLLNTKPVPEKYKNFVGAWKAPGTTLNIYPGGRLEYESPNQVLKAPIQEWSDTGFDAGFLGIGGDFKVTEAPKLVGGRWEMVVDGQRYFKVEP